MSRRTVAPLLRIGAVASWFAFATASARAGDWYVDVHAADCVNATGAASAPFCTITEAVNAAASDDTIHVAPGTYFELLTLQRAVTIIGTNGAAATIVDGGGLGSVASVTNYATIRLEGLTITHGKAPLGGGLYVGDSCGATLDQCVVTGNQADAVDGTGARVRSYGGGIYGFESTITLNGTSVSDNFANAGGGGIRVDGDYLTLNDSTVARNRAGDPNGFNGWGGGIDSELFCVTRLSRCTIESNHNDDLGQGGGGIYCDSLDFVADHLTVRDNHTLTDGGGILAHQLTLTDSTIEDNSARDGGGVCVPDQGGTIARCVIRRNLAVGSKVEHAKAGGLWFAGSIVDCVVEENVADTQTTRSGVDGGHGGGILITNTAYNYNVLQRCVVRGNVATGALGGGKGGGLCIDSAALVQAADCAILGNQATSADPNAAGVGGGIWCQPLSSFLNGVVLMRCTVAGNSADGAAAPPAGSAGGVYLKPGSRYGWLGTTVIAGNSCSEAGGTPDGSGTFESVGFNCIGDTTGVSLTGDMTGNLLDVDPLFADPQNGDFSPRSDSPAIDAGDPGVLPSGADVTGHPRLLDGDFDRTMVVDMGAFEFDHVTLAMSGTPIPGGVLTFTTTGTTGLPVLMLVGTASGERVVRPVGSLFIDLASPWLLLIWGTIPDQRSFTIDPSLSVPAIWFLQPLALDTLSSAANLGNAVTVDIE